jgi:hypothetical protein
LCRAVFESAVHSDDPETVRVGYLVCAGIVEIPIALAAEHLVKLPCKAEIADLLLMQDWGDGRVVVPALIEVAGELPSVPLMLCRACEGSARVVLEAFPQIMCVLAAEDTFRVFLRLFAERLLREEVAEQPWVPDLFEAIASRRGDELGKELAAIAEVLCRHMKISKERADLFPGFLVQYLEATFTASSWPVLEAGLKVLEFFAAFAPPKLEAMHFERIRYYIKCNREPLRVRALSCVIKLARFRNMKESLREYRNLDNVEVMCLPVSHEPMRETFAKLLSLDQGVDDLNVDIPV